jgi:hypothetical protein
MVEGSAPRGSLRGLTRSGAFASQKSQLKRKKPAPSSRFEITAYFNALRMCQLYCLDLSDWPVNVAFCLIFSAAPAYFRKKRRPEWSHRGEVVGCLIFGASIRTQDSNSRFEKRPADLCNGGTPSLQGHTGSPECQPGNKLECRFSGFAGLF